MQSDATTVESYVSQAPIDQMGAVKALRKVILTHLPTGFEECMNYGMIGYVVPKTLYPAGYHCDPRLPLPFMWFAYQKNSINFYHMGIYANPELLAWFQSAYKKIVPSRLDMGKSCVRFKKYDQIPYDLIWELVEKISVNQWIDTYEKTLKKT